MSVTGVEMEGCFVLRQQKGQKIKGLYATNVANFHIKILLVSIEQEKCYHLMDWDVLI